MDNIKVEDLSYKELLELYIELDNYIKKLTSNLDKIEKEVK